MTVEAPRRIALRLRLGADLYSVPLDRVYQVAGYATLTGERDDLFLGWLAFHGEPVPVFDLNRVVCDVPTAENFGSRILIVPVEKADVKYIGLLAAELTDTVVSNDPEVTPLDLHQYLPMLSALVPERPA